MNRRHLATAIILATPLGRGFRARAGLRLARLWRQVLAASLAVAPAVAAPPEAGAQTDIQIHSIEVIQQTPGNVHEDYRRGWTLNARIQGVNPKGSAGGLLYLSVMGGPVNPATFGRTGHSGCVDAGDPDIILSNGEWLADLAGDGVSAGFQLPVIGTTDDDQEQSFTHTFSFGTICDDTQPEPDETFTVRAWFEARTTLDRQRHEGAGLSRDLLIIDYDGTGEPRNLTVTATSSTSFRASWDAPESGLPSGWVYQLEHRGVGAADDGEWTPRPSTRRLSDHVAGLLAGSTYRVRVRSARDDSEHGDWTPEEEVTLPTISSPGVPTVPLNVDAYLDNGKPAVVWDPPANQAEAPPAGYEVQWRTDIDRQWRPVASTGRKAVLSEVGVAGRTYQFRVRAGNDGAPWSAPAGVTVPVVPVAVPGVPLNVEAYLDGRKPAVVWDPPANQAEAPPAGYEVQWRTDVDRQWRSVASTGRKAVLSEVGVSGRTYEFRVRAGNDGAPWSPPASVTVPDAPTPGPPTGVEAYLDGGHPTVTWQPPGNAGDVTITGYEVEYRTTADRMWRNASCGNLGPSARKCRAPSAVAGQEYEFRVRAVSAEGAGDWEESSAVTVPTEPVPGRPTDLSVEIEDAQVVLMWEPPDDADETGVTAYEVAAWRFQHPEPAKTANETVDVQWPYYTAANIAPGCPLKARVRAVGRAGTSGYAYLDRNLRDPWPANAVCEADRPGTPIGVRAVLRTGGHRLEAGRWVHDVNVLWRKPAGDAESYEIVFTPEGEHAGRRPRTVAIPEAKLHTEALEPGDWRVDVYAVNGELRSSTPGTATVTVPEIPPFTIGIREVLLKPQHDDACPDIRSDYGNITSEVKVALDRPAPFNIAHITIGAEPDVVSARTAATGIAAGTTRATVTVRVMCRDRAGNRVKNGHQVTLRVTGAETELRDNARYVEADPTPHWVVVGTPYRSQTPVPSLPAAGSLILGAILAAIGNRRRRYQSRSTRKSQP